MKNLYSIDLEISYLEDLIKYAWAKALKYRADPVASRIHEEYLELVKEMKLELERRA